MITIVSALLGIAACAAWLIYLGRPNRYAYCRPLAIFGVFYTLEVHALSLYVYHTAGWSGQAGMYRYPLAVAITPFLVILGARLTGRRPQYVWKEWWGQPAVLTPNALSLPFFALGLGAAILAMHIAVVGPSNIPLLLLIRHPGAYSYLTEAREDALKLLPFGIAYAIRWNQDIILPTAVLAFLSAWLLLRRGLGPLLAAAPLAAFAAMFTIARSPIAFLMLKCIAIYFLVSRKAIKLRTLILIPVLIAGFAVTVNIVKHGLDWSPTNIIDMVVGSGEDDLIVTPNSLVGRAVYTPSWTVGAHFSHVPEFSSGFLYGRSIGWWTRITGQEAYPLPLMVMSQFKEGNETGIANTCYIGDAWGNFGWPGVILYSLFVGVWLGLFENCLLRLARTPLNMAVFVIASFQALTLVHSALQVYLVTYGGLPLLLAIMYLRPRRDDLPQLYPAATEGST